VSVLVEVLRVTKKGQVTLPKRLREKYGIVDKALVEEAQGGVLLRRAPSPFDDMGSFKPFSGGKTSRQLLCEARDEDAGKMELTDVLYGSINVEKPIDDPKQVAREHIRKKLLDDLK